MSISLASLLAVKSKDDYLSDLLSGLSSAGFPVTSWQSGGVARTLLEVSAAALAELHGLVAAVAAGGFLDTAAGGWLTLLASNSFGVTRRSASFAVGSPCVLTAAAGAGPYTVAAGELWFVSTSGLRYVNTDGGTLSGGGTLTVHLRAESVGAAYTVGPGAITTMLTPLPGVSCSGGGTWTSPGMDEESDEALRARCRAAIQAVGGATAAAYESWSLAATMPDGGETGVTRVNVVASTVTPGRVDAWLAGDGGGVGASVEAAVQAYLRERAPIPVVVYAQSATERALTISGTVYYEVSSPSTAVAAALETYAREVSVGGKVYVAELIQRIMDVPGVVNTALSAPAADVQLDADEVVTFALSLSYSLAT